MIRQSGSETLCIYAQGGKGKEGGKKEEKNSEEFALQTQVERQRTGEGKERDFGYWLEECCHN